MAGFIANQGLRFRNIGVGVADIFCAEIFIFIDHFSFLSVVMHGAYDMAEHVNQTEFVEIAKGHMRFAGEANDLQMVF